MAGVLRDASKHGVARRRNDFRPRDVQDTDPTEWSRRLPADTSAAVPDGRPCTRLRPRPQGKLLSCTFLRRAARPRCSVALRVLVRVHDSHWLGAAAAPLPAGCHASPGLVALFNSSFEPGYCLFHGCPNPESLRRRSSAPPPPPDPVALSFGIESIPDPSRLDVKTKRACLRLVLATKCCASNAS